MNYFRRWSLFIEERFNPVAYTVMIFVFLSSHYVLYLNFFKQKATFHFHDILYFTPLVLAVFIFFFKLRLFDEVKDFDLDRIHNPERPLPRGLLCKSDVLRVALIISILEIVLLAFYGLWALVSMTIVIGYSLLMYKEFFIKKWLRSHLTTYAVTHTFIIVLISITIFIALMSRSITVIPANLIYFSFAGWFLFNIFEFGRKTFASEEEKKDIKTYSKSFGRLGATILVMTMSLLSILLIGRAMASVDSRFLFFWLCSIGLVGLIYVISDRPYIARLYRIATSLYIILTYGTVTIMQLYAIR